MSPLLYVVFFISVVGCIFAARNYYSVRALPEGTSEMQEIAANIRMGAGTFLKSEYKVLIWAVVAVAGLTAVFLSWHVATSFMIGTIMSGLAGFIGMKMATYANVRVTNMARTSLNIGKTLIVALKGGSVMGICMDSFALIGAIIVFTVFQGDFQTLGSVTNWCGFSFVPFAYDMLAYSLGCSTIALFSRVGGGIYTKAADMGADLVGKTEVNIPEDDPRNPGVIADCVGDNVGDVAGLGSDLLESYVGSFMSASILAISIFINYSAKGEAFSAQLLKNMVIYPIAFSGIGLLSCIVSLFYAFHKKNNDNPHKTLNIATWIAASLTAILNLGTTYLLFANQDFGTLPFRFGELSPYIAAFAGIASGVLIGSISEYYTSYDYSPTRKIAYSAKEGSAIIITQGLGLGMNSTMPSVIVLAFALLFAYLSAGIYGTAMAAVGMLSFVGMTVSVDTYGPISDNAGGIAEMAKLNEEVREITDKLDSVGNTTAAIGKGFAIGSATFAAVSLMNSYLYAYTPAEAEAVMDLMNPLILAGLLVGAALSCCFSGILIDAVAKSAKKMVKEIRRQFSEIKGLSTGETNPDYEKCIKIATEGALDEMKTPAILAICIPVGSGLILGPEFVAGILLGATIVAIILAIFCGNSGGAWDNAKKFVESMGKKGTSEHHATVVGDTVGDPLKDTVGPSLDIFIKIMATVSGIAVAIFSKYNLIELFMK